MTWLLKIVHLISQHHPNLKKLRMLLMVPQLVEHLLIKILEFKEAKVFHPFKESQSHSK
jgi:hypothetical protein